MIVPVPAGKLAKKFFSLVDSIPVLLANLKIMPVDVLEPISISSICFFMPVMLTDLTPLPAAPAFRQFSVSEPHEYISTLPPVIRSEIWILLPGKMVIGVVFPAILPCESLTISPIITVPVTDIMASSKVLSPYVNHVFALFFFNCFQMILPIILLYSSGLFNFNCSSGVEPACSCLDENTSSNRPLVVAVMEALVLCLISNEDVASFTIPCASWQELPKYWFNCCIFF